MSGIDWWLPEIPDALVCEAYRQSAVKNVLAALNPSVFFGHFCVCADHQGHGHNTTYPGLDWGQSAEALLWLNRTAEVLASWQYVRSFQREDGLLPFAILPDLAGKTRIIEMAGQKLPLVMDQRGAVYRHYFPGDPMRALANITFIQTADVIFRHTQDGDWLRGQLPALRKALAYLQGLITPDGLLEGRGFYLERPARLNFDGLDQCYGTAAFQLAADLFSAAGQPGEEYLRIAARLADAFNRFFWAGDHCVEYIHPQRGPISHHGLTDVDWIAIATGVLEAHRNQSLWEQVRGEQEFYYADVPTGISTRPESYEMWECYNIDCHDLAAMGRAWYLEAWARARMKDASGLIQSIHKVAQVGQNSDWRWQERYYSPKTGDLARHHFPTYCEYPANLIRIVQRFVMGVRFEADGGLTLNPVVPAEWYRRGFGQTLCWGANRLTYRIEDNHIRGSYVAPKEWILRIHTTSHRLAAGDERTFDLAL